MSINQSYVSHLFLGDGDLMPNTRLNKDPLKHSESAALSTTRSHIRVARGSPLGFGPPGLVYEALVHVRAPEKEVRPTAV